MKTRSSHCLKLVLAWLDSREDLMKSLPKVSLSLAGQS